MQVIKASVDHNFSQFTKNFTFTFTFYLQILFPNASYKECNVFLFSFLRKLWHSLAIWDIFHDFCCLDGENQLNLGLSIKICRISIGNIKGNIIRYSQDLMAENIEYNEITQRFINAFPFWLRFLLKTHSLKWIQEKTKDNIIQFPGYGPSRYLGSSTFWDQLTACSAGK